jgi:Arm DNA-binding domain/Phage integrase SAM-like domain
MQSSVKLIIRKGKLRKDGNHVVFIQYCYTSVKRVLISTDISVPAAYWDNDNSCIMLSLPSEHGSPESIQSILDQIRMKAERIINYALKNNHTCPMQFLKRNFRLPDCWNFDQMEDENNSLSVFYQIDRYLDNKRGMILPSTVTIIKTMKKHLIAFQEYIGYKITFDRFDAVFYEQFVRYLTFDFPLMRRTILLKGLKVNTVGKQLNS